MPIALELHAEADDQQLLAQVVDYYQRALKGSQEAQDYLRGRGITNGQAIDRFHIGYADRTLGASLPPKQVKAGAQVRERLAKLGLFRASGHEHFSGSVVFPIGAADGTQRIVDVYARKILGRRLRKGTPLHTYLGTERHGVWNVEALEASEEIILCPSLFDALTFWNHGYRNVTCTFGPAALTADHLAAFAAFGVKRILTACEEVAPRLTAAGLECFLLRFPVGTDANAFACRVDNPAEALAAVLRRAEWVAKGTAASASAPPTTAPPVTPPQLPGAEEPAASENVPSLTRAESLDPSVPPTSLQPASPLPLAPASDDDAVVSADEVVMHFGPRRYRVRGWSKNLSFEQLRVNLMVSNDRLLFVDTFDLYSARHRRAFVSQAATELAVDQATLNKDLGRLLLKLEALQDDQIAEMSRPKETSPSLTEEQKQEALRFLRAPGLLERLVADFQVVGESTNKLVGYLAAISRKLDEPLAVIIQSSSAAGKTALMDAVLAFVPPEDQVKYSAVTGQALFYMGESNLKHKILAIVEEEGAERAGYALKLLQSEGELMIASTGKDAGSGRLITQTYRVEGPVMLFLTTTAITIDEELLNRCLVLTVNEDREQTRAIHHWQRQRQTLPGLLARQEHERTLALHRNAQRLLRPLLVANPFAEALTFLDDKTRTRRDHVKYLTMIRAIALLHQHQRPIHTVEHQGRLVEYLEVTLEDIETANRLASEVLGRSVDELPPQTRRLLGLIDGMVRKACQAKALARADYRFSRRDVREYCGWGNTQLKIHLKRLEELEYLLVHRGGRGQSFVYELLYEAPADQGQRFLARLINVEQLRHTWPGSNVHKSVANEDMSGNGRPQVGVTSWPSRPRENDDNPGPDHANPANSSENAWHAHGGEKNDPPS